MIEAQSNSIVQFNPDVDQHNNYFVVAKEKGIGRSKKCLRTNFKENILFLNQGKSIQVFKIGTGKNWNKGIQKTKINLHIKNSKSQNVFIEEYLPLLNKGIITVDSTGLIEIFLFDINGDKWEKKSEFNIN